MCHHFAASSDGGDTWENVNLSDARCIPDPGVQASLLGVGDGGTVLLASPLIDNRCGDHLRGNLTLYKSSDFGRTWNAGDVIYEDCSGYSTMHPLGNGLVGVVWSTDGLPRGGPVYMRSIKV